MSSKASQMHFALILVKGAEEAWGIGLIGQRLPYRNPVHHSFQDGVIHVVIEEQWKSASQGRDSSRAYSAINQWKN